MIFWMMSSKTNNTSFDTEQYIFVELDQENNFLLYWDTMKLNDDYIEGYRKGRKLEI